MCLVVPDSTTHLLTLVTRFTCETITTMVFSPLTIFALEGLSFLALCLHWGAWWPILPSTKQFSFFLKVGIGTRKFIIFLLVIKIFLIPFCSWFVFYHVFLGRQGFSPCNNTHFCWCLQWWSGWSDLTVTFVCAYTSVVVCSSSKIANIFWYAIHKRIHQAKLWFLIWYLQATWGIRLSKFWCPCLQSSPNDNSF